MDEKTLEKNNEIEIDLRRILNAILNKAWLAGVLAVVCAVLTFLGTFLFVTPKYESAVKFYVNNSSISVGDITASLTSSDISAAKSLVKSYIVILNTRETLNDVIDYAGVNRSYAQLRRMISAEAVDSTEIFEIIVTSEDPHEAEAIANAIAYILPKRIDSIIEGTSSKVVESAVVATSPSSPSYTTNSIIGFLVGLLLVVVIVVLHVIFDITIRVEEDITSGVKHPVLAAIPNMVAPTKGGYGYRKRAYDKTKHDPGEKTEIIGDGISFAAAEAYKLLRTKLQFSFADDASCHIIGLSSAMTGEGKSLTAVNLAFSMSQLGQRVLLIDADMRRPSIDAKLPVKQSPGLSDYLSGQVRGEHLIQYCGLTEDMCAFHVISAGRIPPNPMELLSSGKMERTLSKLRESYDLIILDLPPVGEVGDALVTAKLTDGVLLVVRQDQCNRVALNAAIRQFEFVGSRILGIVFNCASEESGGYQSKYYRRYGRKYYRNERYDTSYAHAKVGTKRTDSGEE